MPDLPPFNPADFTPGQRIDNRYFTLTPGTITSFYGENGEGNEQNDFFVTYLTTTIAGVQVIVVRDTAYADGVMIEDTLDWFAQDEFGNVWYLGEDVNNYRYDDEGNFIGTDHGGAWEAGVDGALPGWIMEAVARINVGDNYYQEFAEDVALDAATVSATGMDYTVDGHTFHNVIRISESSELDPGIIGFKYYAPNIGLIAVEEFNAQGELEFTSNLIGSRNLRSTDQRRLDAPERTDFDGDTLYLKFTSADTDSVNALGAYTFDLVSGVIGEAWIVFDAIGDETSGTIAFNLPPGQGLGLFLIPGADDSGIDLSQFEDGGLFFVNFLTGAPATLKDGMAPVIVDEDGHFLPLQAFHALGSGAGFNLLNPGTGINAIESTARPGGRGNSLNVISFEEDRVTDPDYDGDFDDLVVTISNNPFAVNSSQSSLATLEPPRCPEAPGKAARAETPLDAADAATGWSPAAWGQGWASHQGGADWWVG